MALALTLETILEEQHFETELLHLQLTDGRESVFTGQGMLTWDIKEGIRVEAITDGGAELIQSVFKGGAQPGKLLEAGDYLRLTADTQSGVTIGIERLMYDGSRSHVDSPHVVWKWSQRDLCSPLTIEDAAGKRGKSTIEPTIEMLLQPLSLPFWPEYSTVTDNNPHFGRRTSFRDWLTVTVGATTFVARKHTDSTVRVRVHPIAPEHNDMIGAIRLAFCFLTGRKVGVLVSESTTETGTTLGINTGIEPSTNSFAPPLGRGIELVADFVPLLSKAVAFFMSKKGMSAASLLSTCWDTVDNSLTTECVVAGAALEGLIGILKGKSSSTGLISKDQEKKLKQFLTDEMYPERFISRLEGLLGMMKHPNPKQVILDWQSRGILGVSEEDAEGWGMIRHRAAHGRSSSEAMTTAKLQETLDCLNRVRTMINKLVLQLMGYTGTFFDYSVWDVKEFPLADPSAL